MVPVCVTGATGFIASHIVKELLTRGHRVRGTVRDPRKADVLRALPGAAERLEIVTADLMDAASLAAAVKGCEHVMHTASPYALTVKDPARDLVEPAVKGTTFTLDACKNTAKRVVLTSSVAAICDQGMGDKLTEADWNQKSSLDRNPYYYSKTMAERAAWDFVKREIPSFDLVAINPGLVIGPSLIPSVNPSVMLIQDMLNGKQPAIARLEWGVVDVRDVAKAHVLAMENPKASGRYICVAGTVDMQRMVDILIDTGLGKKLPKFSLATPFGDKMVKLFSYTQPKGTGQYVRTNVGGKLNYDNTKIKKELGLKFIPVEETIKDTARDLVKWGHAKG